MLLNHLSSWMSKLRFSTNSILRDAKSTAENSTISNLHRVTDWEKRILVFSGKFKSTSEIPPKVSMDLMQNALSRARIRLCHIMMVITVMGASYVIIRSKMDQKHDVDDAQKRQEEFRRQITQEYRNAVNEKVSQKS